MDKENNVLLKREIVLSVVSHNQAMLVKHLLDDLDKSGAGNYLKEVIITNNIPDKASYHLDSAPLKIIDNLTPKGFGENHNEAFRQAKAEYFCVINPDIRLNKNPFPELLKALESQQTAVVAPFVYTPDNIREDNIRYFPTILNTSKKLIMLSDGRYPVGSERDPFEVEWAAGMFLLFNVSDFRKVGGFDEKFFLYYEDVDICLRIWRMGRYVVACPQAVVIHTAQRASHKSFRYFRWHISSLLRYFFKHWLRLPDIGAREVHGR